MRILHLAFNRSPAGSPLNEHLKLHHSTYTPETNFLTSFPNERVADVTQDYVRILSSANLFSPDAIVVEVDEAPENCVPGRTVYRVTAKDARFNGFIQLILERMTDVPTIFIIRDPTKWPECVSMEITSFLRAKPTAILGAADVDCNGWHIRYAGTQNWDLPMVGTSMACVDDMLKQLSGGYRMTGLEGLILSPTYTGADPDLSRKAWAQIHSGLPGAYLGLPDPGFGISAWEGWSGIRRASWGLVVAYSEGWLSDRAGQFARAGIVPVPYEGPQLGCDNQFRMIPRYSHLRNPPPNPWSDKEYRDLLAEALSLTNPNFDVLDQCLYHISDSRGLPNPLFGGFYETA